MKRGIEREEEKEKEREKREKEGVNCREWTRE